MGRAPSGRNCRRSHRPDPLPCQRAPDVWIQGRKERCAAPLPGRHGLGFLFLGSVPGRVGRRATRAATAGLSWGASTRRLLRAH
eukprot:6081569-Pyramimonas_sp.AAC.1